MAQVKPIETLGFIGLGVMGEPMCANLLAKSGRTVFGYDPRQEPLERLAPRGLKVCGSAADIACDADAVFLSLPSIDEVEQVCAGIVASGGRAHTIVDMSTSAVKQTRDLAKQLAEKGVAFVDAPVARTRQAARDGTLSIMVGSTREVFDALHPFLACMGADISHCGDVGCGQVVKILNNMVLFMTVNALAEALAIGRAAGMDGRLLFETMAKGSSDSFALRNQGLKALVPGVFPVDAFATDYALKDIRLALELAEQGRIDAGAARHTHALLGASKAAGNGKAYYPALIKLIEKQLSG